MGRANYTNPTVTVDSTLADAEEIDVRNYAGGSVHVPHGSSLTTLTFYSLHAAGGTMVAAYDNANVAVTLTVSADRVVQLPDAIFGFPFIKMVGNADGEVSLFLKG